MAQTTETSSEMDDQPTILRPIPRRAFDLINTSSESSTVPTPSSESSSTSQKMSNKDTPPSRTPSVLNLTSSTLFGIYSPTSYSYGDKEEPPTPCGPGTQTPINGQMMSLENVRSALLYGERPWAQQRTTLSKNHYHHHHHHSQPAAPHHVFLSLATRTVLLFIFGVAYGVIITHLHDEQQLAPVQVESFNRYDWPYLFVWGIAGVGLGSLLPWVDLLWENKRRTKNLSSTPIRTRSSSEKSSSAKINAEDEDEDDSESSSSSLTGPVFKGDWNPVVRSIGAFVGIAFAIRKLPWQSTLQVSLTLALVNPVLWYLIDRSKPGFFLSALVGVTGTALLFNINPDIVPAPATVSPPALSTSANTSASGWHGLGVESIGVGTWIASVLFCSCVCFGNIGRRLALRTSS